MTYQMALLESKLEGEERGREENTIKHLKAVMKKLNFTAEKAMDFLDVPEDKRSRLLTMLNK